MGRTIICARVVVSVVALSASLFLSSGMPAWAVADPCVGPNDPPGCVTPSAEPSPSATSSPSPSASTATFAPGTFDDPEQVRAVGLALALLVFLASLGTTRSFARGAKAS